MQTLKETSAPGVGRPPFQTMPVKAWAAAGGLVAMILSLVGAPSLILAQGAFSARNDFSSTDLRYLFGTDGVTKLPTNSGRVEVLFNGQVLSSVQDGTGNTLGLPGLFALGVLDVPGVPAGGSAVVVVRAWDNSTGATFNSAGASASEEVLVGPLGGGLTLPSAFTGFHSLALGCGNCGAPAAPNQAITFAALKNVTYPAGPVSLTGSASSGLPVAFSATGPATVSGNVLTVTGAGLVVVTANQAGNGVYSAAPPIARKFFVNPAPQVISFTAPPAVVFNTNPVSLSASASSGLPITFVVKSGPAFVAGNQLNFTGWGVVAVEATQPGNSVVAPAPPVTHWIDAEQPQVISFSAPASLPYTTSLIPLGATASSGLPVSYAVGSGPGVIVAGQLLVSGVGDVVVTATQPGNDVVAPAAPVSRTITITRAPQVIQFETPTNTYYTPSPITLVAVASSFHRVNLALQDGPATLVNDTLRLTAPGVVTIVATVPGDALYLPATPVTNVLNFPKIPQTVSFAALPDIGYTAAAIPLTASASSGLPVVFSVVSGPAFISGTNVFMTGPGRVSVAATQAGTAIYAAAGVTNTFSAKLSQTLSFSKIQDTAYPAAPVSLVASASSGLPVSFGWVSGPATVNGSTLTVTGAGVISVAATQAGGDTYYPAPPVTNSFTVQRGAQSISFATPPSAPFSTHGLALTASASSGLTVAFSVVGGPASISGSSLSMTGVGPVSVAAFQPGDSNYLPAPPVTNTLQVFSAVAGRWIFYNHSAWDGNDPSANALDDLAIAPDKTPLLPGQKAGFTNYTGYSRGINGLMVDLIPGGAHTAVTAADFAFVTGNDNLPQAWPAAQGPASVTVRPGSTPNQPDRITLIWPDQAISGAWLGVKVQANARTTLGSADVFFWGNAPGDTGNSAANAQVNALDEAAVRVHPASLLQPAPLTAPWDVNRDKQVNGLDEAFVRTHATTFLSALNLIDLTGDPSGFARAPSLAAQPGRPLVAAFALASNSEAVVEAAVGPEAAPELWEAVGPNGPWSRNEVAFEAVAGGTVCRWTVPAAPRTGARFFQVRQSGR